MKGHDLLAKVLLSFRKTKKSLSRYKDDIDPKALKHTSLGGYPPRKFDPQPTSAGGGGGRSDFFVKNSMFFAIFLKLVSFSTFF